MKQTLHESPLAAILLASFIILLFIGYGIAIWLMIRRNKKQVEKYYQGRSSAKPVSKEVDRLLALDEHEQRIS